jgi:hypothetical protein
MTLAALSLAVASAPFAVICNDERATLARMLAAADALTVAAPAVAADIVRTVAGRLTEDARVHMACDNVTKGDIVSALAAACVARA